MKAGVKSRDCWGCGYCAAVCPEVFKINDKDGKCYMIAMPSDENAQKVQEVADACPARIIDVWED